MVHLLDEALAGEYTGLDERPLLHPDRAADVDLVLDHFDRVRVLLDGLITQVSGVLRDIAENGQHPAGNRVEELDVLVLGE